MQNEVKIVITTDASGAVTGIRQFEEQSKKTTETVKSQWSTLKKHWLGISASIASAMYAVHKGMEYVELGAMAMQAEESFRLVTEASDIFRSRLLENMKLASAGTIDDSAIMQKAVKGIVQGLDETQLVRIMEAARVSARVAGEDVQTAYETITDAIANNLPRALSRYGLLSKEDISLVNKALAEGIENVNIYGMAMANAAIQGAKFGEMQDNTSEKLQQHKTRVQGIKEEIGKMGAEMWMFLQGAGAEWFTFWQKAGAQPSSMFSGLTHPSWSKLPQAGQQAGQPTAFAGSEDTPISDTQRERLKKLNAEMAEIQKKNIEANIRAQIEAEKAQKKLEQLLPQFDAWKAKIDAMNPSLSETGKTMILLNQEADKFIKGGIDKGKVEGLLGRAKYDIDLKTRLEKSKKDAEDMRRAWSAEREFEFSVAEPRSGELEKQFIAIDKWVEAMRDKVTLFVTTVADYEDKMARVDAIAGELKLKATAKSDLGLDESKIKLQIAFLDRAEKEMTMSKPEVTERRVAAAEDLLRVQEAYLATLTKAEDPTAWYMQQNAIEDTRKKLLELDLALKEQTGTLTDGMARGAKEWLYNVKTPFQTGVELSRSTGEAMGQGFEDYFFDPMEFKFDNFLNSLRRLMAKATSEMIMDLIRIQMKAGQVASGGGGLFGGIASFLGLAGGTGGSPMGAESFSTEAINSMVWLAKGGVNTSPALARLESTIVERPVIFPMAKGYGLVGEAGPEGIFPLARTRSGELGVKAIGGSSGEERTVYITINAVDAKSFYDLCRENPEAILDVNERSAGKGGKMRKIIKGAG